MTTRRRLTEEERAAAALRWQAVEERWATARLHLAHVMRQRECFAADLHQQGISYSQIAEVTGLSTPRIAQLVQAHLADALRSREEGDVLVCTCDAR